MSYKFTFDDIFVKNDIDNIISMQSILRHHNKEGKDFINKMINKEIEPTKLFYLNLILFGIDEPNVYGNFKLLSEIDQKNIVNSLNETLLKFSISDAKINDCIISLKRDFRLNDDFEISMMDM